MTTEGTPRPACGNRAGAASSAAAAGGSSAAGSVTPLPYRAGPTVPCCHDCSGLTQPCSPRPACSRPTTRPAG